MVGAKDLCLWAGGYDRKRALRGVRMRCGINRIPIEVSRREVIGNARRLASDVEDCIVLSFPESLGLDAVKYISVLDAEIFR